MILFFGRIVNPSHSAEPETATPGVYDTQHDAPQYVSFSCTPASGSAPLTVRCDASSSHGACGPVRAYVWIFGDGPGYEGKDPIINHTYEQPGTYTIQLFVQDSFGLGSDVKQTIIVS
jgi:PKD repeat protein